MRIFGRIILGLIGIVVLLFIASWLIYGWYYRTTNNPQPDNKKITFVGNVNRSHYYSKACQLKDGSIAIASVLSRSDKIRDNISIIKLSAEGEFLWEHKFAFAKLSFWDFVPALLRKGKGHQYIKTLSIDFTDDKYYLLLNRYNLKIYEPHILTLDSQGKLLNSYKMQLKISLNTSSKGFIQNNFAYLSYLDQTDKILYVAKLDIKTGDLINKSMLFFKQNDLNLTAFAADKADTTISLTAYDSKKGCSFYMYTPKDDLKEYFRTSPNTEITVLKYIDDKLYGIIKEDSLLRIVDLTSLSKPLILETDIPRYKRFKVKDLQFINGDFYVCMDVTNQDKHEFSNDIVINKYSHTNETSSGYLIQGKNYETASYLFKTADNQMIVIGNSGSMKPGKSYRVFASKFKL